MTNGEIYKEWKNKMENPKPKMKVLVRVPGRDFRGQVEWVRGEQIGIRWDDGTRCILPSKSVDEDAKVVDIGS